MSLARERIGRVRQNNLERLEKLEGQYLLLVNVSGGNELVVPILHSNLFDYFKSFKRFEEDDILEITMTARTINRKNRKYKHVFGFFDEDLGLEYSVGLSQQLFRLWRGDVDPENGLFAIGSRLPVPIYHTIEVVITSDVNAQRALDEISLHLYDLEDRLRASGADPVEIESYLNDLRMALPSIEGLGLEDELDDDKYRSERKRSYEYMLHGMIPDLLVDEYDLDYEKVPEVEMNEYYGDQEKYSEDMD